MTSNSKIDLSNPDTFIPRAKLHGMDGKKDRKGNLWTQNSKFEQLKRDLDSERITVCQDNSLNKDEPISKSTSFSAINIDHPTFVVNEYKIPEVDYKLSKDKSSINENNSSLSTEVHLCGTNVLATDDDGQPIKYEKNRDNNNNDDNKNWSPIYTVPVFAKSFTYTENVVMTGHRYRRPTIMELPEHLTSKASVRNVIFGSPKCRRFSQDLMSKQAFDEIENDGFEIKDETPKIVFFQIFLPFLIAGIGNVITGLILEYVHEWPVFTNVGGLYVLVASFIGFKGNLETTLAARLSTKANLGQLVFKSQQLNITTSNIALLQFQSIILGVFAAIIAILSNFYHTGSLNFKHFMLLFVTSMTTASVCGLVLGLIMISVVLISMKLKVNPDNVSTLVAAFVGDLTAVAIVAILAKFFYHYNSALFAGILVISFFFLALLCGWYSVQNEYTSDVVSKGWWAIITSVSLSSFGGFIFDIAARTYATIVLFQPTINGVGSNLIAVQISRISTYFHQRTKLSVLPTEEGEQIKICVSPHKAFFGSNPNTRTARLLLLMVVPGHLIYIVLIKLLKPQLVFITGYFITFYILVAIIQISILIYVAHLTVPLFWKIGFDPDNYAIPILMSLGDLIGTILFNANFMILEALDDPNAI